MEFKVNDDNLEKTLAKVEAVRNWSPRVISKLENSIRTANDEDLFRLNPLYWASQKSVDEHEAVDLFLHGAKAGLFYMEWNVICRCCGKIMQSLRDLHGLHSHDSCNVCFRKDSATLDDYVQITFTLSPSIRALRFHQPETLSLEEYCFRYLFEPSARSAGILTLADVMQLFKRHFSTFSPGEKILVETEAAPGFLSCVDVFHQRSFGLLASGEPTTETRQITVTLTDTGFEVPLPALQPGEYQIGPVAYAGTLYQIRPGKVVIEFKQHATAKTALMVVYFPSFGVPADIQMPAGVEIAYSVEKSHLFRK